MHNSNTIYSIIIFLIITATSCSRQKNESNSARNDNIRKYENHVDGLILWLKQNGFQENGTFDTTTVSSNEMWSYQRVPNADDSIFEWIPNKDSSYFLITNYTKTPISARADKNKIITFDIYDVNKKMLFPFMVINDSMSLLIQISHHWQDTNTLYLLTKEKENDSILLQMIKIKVRSDTSWVYTAKK